MPKTKKKKTKTELDPIDVYRCQAEVPNGHSFMTLGGVPGLVRCSNLPAFMIVEKEEAKDGARGAMSLCENCMKVAKQQLKIPILVYQMVGSYGRRKLKNGEQK